ncbi:Methyltransferase domain-containing protein [Shouchella lonarensis]|uniref:Methyltransferase domain-containing protein n=1 Tax=Shouchella lonarensis TaxID=1464122 RepID=A0A1G6L6I2_9BACI|nr:Methyltransferase domain-containing protein [Shouchella lonarensis]
MSTVSKGKVKEETDVQSEANSWDYEETLRKWLKKVQPKTILEYGPGRSTEMMLEECPDARIVGIEHQEYWYKETKEKLGDRVELLLQPISNIRSHYACWPLMQTEVQKYDFIFVDGRRRLECLMVAQAVLNKNGVVLLHDAERKEYDLGTALFDLVEYNEQTRTKVLALKDNQLGTHVDEELNNDQRENEKEKNQIDKKVVVLDKKINQTDEKEKKREITFVTAAYGEKYHQYVRGLARTFSANNDATLVVYTDEKNMKLPQCKLQHHLSMDEIQKEARDLPLRSAKSRILADAAKRHEFVCWLDADTLIYTNLQNKLDLDKINVIGYGYGRNMRDCGGGLEVKQSRYGLGAMYAMPQKYILELEKLWQELRSAIEQMKVKIYDQSILNHIIMRHQANVKYLNESYLEMGWNFKPFMNKKYPNKPAHPRIENRNFCTGLKIKNGQLYHRETPFATLCWTALSLEQQLSNRFKHIADSQARKHLRDVYA